jgi:hypothetical protein
MLSGSSSHRSNRQSGRHNESKEKRSNRKPVKHPKIDKNETEEIKVDIVGAEIESAKLLNDVETPVVQPPTDQQKYLKNKLAVDKEAMSKHDLVALERPPASPSWFQQKLAFTPSKSYVSKTRSDDNKIGGHQNVPDDATRHGDGDTDSGL